MKATGIIRKVDELGRLVLPIEMRRILDIAEKDAVEIYVEGESIILRKFQPFCVLCGSTDKLISYQGKRICAECVKNMQELV